MYILNTTYLIDKKAESDFVAKFNEEILSLVKHIKEVSDFGLYKVHTNNEGEEISLSFQLHFKDLNQLDAFSKTYSQKIEVGVNSILSKQIPYFQTLLEKYE